MTWNKETEAKTHPPDKPYCASYPEPDYEYWPEVEGYLRSRGLDPGTARANGWYPSKHVDGWGRIVVPCKSDQPGNLYWQARLLGPLCGPRSPLEKTLAAKTGLGMPRRWESPHGVSRGNAIGMVWAPDGQARWNGRGVVVEGPMDALACAYHGYLSVALLSATPSEECLNLTAEMLRGIIILVIMDAGAEDPMIFNAGYLRERGINCRLVNPYPYKDIADCPQDQLGRFLRNQEPRT